MRNDGREGPPSRSTGQKVGDERDHLEQEDGEGA